MSPARHMYQLQVVEQAIGQSEKALVEVDLRLGSNEALESARIRAEEGRQALASVQGQQRDLDLEVQGMATHLKELEARLYGGAPATTKELMALQQDIGSVGRRKAHQEDQLLQLMLQVDEAREVLGRLEATLAKEEASWRGERERLESDGKRLRADLADLRERQGPAEGALSAPETAMYRSLRSSRGAAVATVERGICGGCGITLPSSELQRTRTSLELVRCGSCGRVLYTG